MKEEGSERPHHIPVVRLLLSAVLLLALLQVSVLPAFASSGRRVVVPSGRAVGIKLFSDGVLVVGLEEVGGAAEKSSPARACGLRVGDVITHVDGDEVNTIEEVREHVEESAGGELTIRAVRDGKSLQFTAEGAEDATGGYKLGAWLRDSMAGIGTVTFYEPESGLFAALGHGINDVDTALLMPLEEGGIMYATVSDVKRGESGSPGELHGAFQVNRDMGELFANTPSGVFGISKDGCDELKTIGKPMEIAARQEVKVGKAAILSNIAGDRTEEYEVEITRVYPASSNETRNLMVKVTDQRLLNATGGIVQGMSGSPIIQNGRLVGAVTHVLIDEPDTGYGILAENMLKAAEKVQKTA